MRSWIVIPADNDEALISGAVAGAEAVVIDLARGGNADTMARMRLRARDFLSSHRQQVVATRSFQRWARVSSLDTSHWRADLDAVMEARPDGIVLSGCTGAAQIRQFASVLYEVEERVGISANSTFLMPQIGGTPAAALAVSDLAHDLNPRVTALTWDAAGLTRAIGARRTHRKAGGWIDPLAYLRAQVLLVSHARGIDAVEPAFADVSDSEGSKRAAEAARADGFSGMIALHPSQVPLIEGAFAPNEEERVEAQQLVSAFAVSPNAESLGFKGRRVGQADLRRARRVLGDI